jgi:hypothetical protein
VIGAVELATYSDKHQGWSANVSDGGVSVSFVYGHKEGQKEEQYDASYSMTVFLSGPLGCQPF